MNVSNKFKGAPMMLSNTDGVIIFKNESAHLLSSVVNIGTPVSSLISEDELEYFHSQINSNTPSEFTAKTTIPGCLYVTFDLTRGASDGIWRIYPSPDHLNCDKKPFTYNDLAKEFLLCDAHSSSEEAIHFTRLYDSLVSLDYVFEPYRNPTHYKILPIIDRLINIILPKLRYFNRKINFIMRDTVCEGSVVYADPFSLLMVLCAICSACGFVAEGDVLLSADELEKEFVIDVSAEVRSGITINNAASFSSHSCDIIYADIISRHCGYDFKYFTFSLPSKVTELTCKIKIPTNIQPTSYVKASPEAEYILNTACEYVENFFCSAKQ